MFLCYMEYFCTQPQANTFILCKRLCEKNTGCMKIGLIHRLAVEVTMYVHFIAYKSIEYLRNKDQFSNLFCLCIGTKYSSTPRLEINHRKMLELL